MSNQRAITYMDYQWVEIDGNTLTVGLNDEGLIDVDEITSLQLPPENEPAITDEVCGEIETSDGTIDLYSPVKGVVSEINQAVLENPDLLMDDPGGEGWLFKIEAEDPKEVREFMKNAGKADDDDDDEDEDDDDDSDSEEDLDEGDDEDEDEEEDSSFGRRGRRRLN